MTLRLCVTASTVGLVIPLVRYPWGVAGVPIEVRCASHVQWEKLGVVERHSCGVRTIACHQLESASFGVVWAAVVHRGGVVAAYWSSSVVVVWAFVHEEGPQLVANCAVEHHPCGVPLNVGDHREMGDEFVAGWQVVAHHPWWVEYSHGRAHYSVG